MGELKVSSSDTVELKQYSIISKVEELGFHFEHSETFNYSSANTQNSRVTPISVALFDSSEGVIQLIFSRGRFISLANLQSALNLTNLSLKRSFEEKTWLPLSKSVELQPLLPEQNVMSYIDRRLLNSRFCELRDAVQNKVIVIESSILKTILKAESINLTDFEQSGYSANPKGDIKFSTDVNEINEHLSDTMLGSMIISDKRVLRESQEVLKGRDLYYPIFPRTSDEVMFIADSGIIENEEIIALLEIDFMLLGAYLIKAHQLYPELSHKDYNLSQVVGYVGVKNTFDIIHIISKISLEREISDDIEAIYSKLASHLNVASIISFNVIDKILEQTGQLQSKFPTDKPFKIEKAKLYSRIINFPLLLLIGNLSKDEYRSFFDHTLLNPTTNSVILTESTLGFNETDFVIALLKEKDNFPDDLLTMFREQYTPFYSKQHHVYPNLMYLVAALLSNKGVVLRSSVITDSMKLIRIKALRMGISDSAFNSIISSIEKFKVQAIKKIGIHNQKSSQTKQKIMSFESKYYTTVF